MIPFDVRNETLPAQGGRMWAGWVPHPLLEADAALKCVCRCLGFFLNPPKHLLTRCFTFISICIRLSLRATIRRKLEGTIRRGFGGVGDQLQDRALSGSCLGSPASSCSPTHAGELKWDLLVEVDCFYLIVAL